MSRLQRLLLWDLERAGFAYDLLCALLLLFLFSGPPAGLGDPLAGR